MYTHDLYRACFFFLQEQVLVDRPRGEERGGGVLELTKMDAISLYGYAFDLIYLQGKLSNDF